MGEMVVVQRPANGKEERVCPPRLMTLKDHRPEVFVAAAPVAAEAEMAGSRVVVPSQERAVRWLTASGKRAECEGKRGHLFVHQDEEV